MSNNERIEPFDGMSCGQKPSENFNECFDAGVRFAISHQWVSVEERLPDESEEVLCMMKSNGAVVSGFIFRNKKGISEVATDSCFHFEDYGGYEPTHWMHKPQLNNEKAKQ